MKIKQSKKDRIFIAVVAVILGICVLACVYPLYLVLINSISDPYLVARGKVTILPKGFTLKAYIEAFKNNEILIGYRNSLFYTFVGTTTSMIATIPAAYALSKTKYWGHKFITLFFIFTLYFNAGIVPSFLVMKHLGLLNTWFAIPLRGVINVANLVVARSFFESGVPKELEESAEIDGCSIPLTFVKIVMPLSKAMLTVILLYYAEARWNNYTYALYYLPTATDKFPLQMVLRNMVQRMQQATLTNAFR